jgi:hypothetical protein
MLQRIIVLLAVAIATASSADESSSLRIDASSGRAFERSLTTFKQELSPERRQAFGDALVDIWIAGTQSAELHGRKYRTEDYYRQIDGLGYAENVALTTGESAKQRALQASAGATPDSSATPRGARAGTTPERPSPWAGVPPLPPAFLGLPQAGASSLMGPSLQQ